MHKGNKYDNARTLIALLIVLLAFGVFLLFYNNADTILNGNQFYLFMTLSTIGMGLLLGLLYLVNNASHPSKTTTTTHHKVAAKKTTKKKTATKKKK